MANFYNLQIIFEPSFETYQSISEILALSPSERIPFSEVELKNGPNLWQHEVEEKITDPYFDFITYYTDIIISKSEELFKLEINRDAISIWFLYAYKDQCNLEFEPVRLKKLADSCIKLCISCWQED
ncbi:hypothetical protein [Adhaeribacter terreus]|uniref:DUF4279 domain-containing protein n=1 Tax=Adhaeribacter terreus TaxID=529703 RepID=A0ABW0EE58_9BACT